MNLDLDGTNSELYVHLLWSTNHQEPVLSPISKYLYHYLCELALSCDCHIVDGKVFSDHVQLVVKFSPETPLDNLITTLKTASSLLIRTNYPLLKNFEWQKADFTFTVDPETACSIIPEKCFRPFSEEIAILLTINELEYDFREILV